MRKAIALLILLTVPAYAGEHSLADGGKTPVQLQAPQPPPADERGAKINAEVGENVVEGANPVKQVQVVPQRMVNYNLLWGQFLRSTNRPTAVSVSLLPDYSQKKGVQNTNSTQSAPPQSTNQQAQVAKKHLTGYCYFDRALNITTLTLPVELPCQFSDGSVGILAGELMPDLKTYSLILKPQRVIINGVEYKVSSGYVLNRSRSSMNVADEVNKQYLKKVLYAAVSQGATEGLNAYQQYVQGKYTTTTVVGTDNPVVVQDHNYPSSYPIVSAALGFLKGLTQAFSQIIQKETNNVPVLYKVNSGKVVYVNLYVERTQ
jgi:hypothetical protein